MRKWTIPVLLIVMFLMAACGKAAGNSTNNPLPDVVMGPANFTSYTHITIKAGQSVVFIDAQNGALHNLVTGTSGNYMAEPGAPAPLNSAGGVTFNAGDRQTFVFATPGTYKITCTIHDPMELTVVVER